MAEATPDEMISLWSTSAEAWDKAVLEDVNRIGLLDSRALNLMGKAAGQKVLDVGCGEGRFVRMLLEKGAHAEGLDPIPHFINLAKERCPEATWHLGRAEEMDLTGYDWVVCYLSLIDVADLAASVAACAKAMVPGGKLLNITLSPFATTRTSAYETDPETGEAYIRMEDYSSSRPQRVGWKGIEIINFHRPLDEQLMCFVNQGLILRHYQEAVPTDSEIEQFPKLSIQQKLPLFNLQVWEKPHAPFTH